MDRRVGERDVGRVAAARRRRRRAGCVRAKLAPEIELALEERAGEHVVEDLQVTSYKLQVTSYKLKITSYKLPWRGQPP